MVIRNPFKKIIVPVEDTVDLEVYDAYVVEWTSRHGKYSDDTKQSFKIFTTKADAETFAKALTSAFKLLQHTSGREVKVYPTEKGNN